MSFLKASTVRLMLLRQYSGITRELKKIHHRTYVFLTLMGDVAPITHNSAGHNIPHVITSGGWAC
jgi:hypothetical protein